MVFGVGEKEVHARRYEAVLQWSPEILVQEALFVKHGRQHSRTVISIP